MIKENRTILEYSSPSGKIVISKYVPPFKEVEKGFGFYGIIAEDLESGRLQCHICGNWFKHFGSHLKNKHNISSKEYKDRFGLLSRTALVCKEGRVRQSKVMSEVKKRYTTFGIKTRYRKGHNNSNNNREKGTPLKEEKRNELGVCDLQIATKILFLWKKLEKRPTLSELNDFYGSTFVETMRKRYGSYLRYCENDLMKIRGST